MEYSVQVCTYFQYDTMTCRCKWYIDVGNLYYKCYYWTGCSPYYLVYKVTWVQCISIPFCNWCHGFQMGRIEIFAKRDIHHIWYRAHSLYITSIYNKIHMYSGITSGRVLNGGLLYTKILEVNLFAFAYRLFRRDFSLLDGTYCMGTHIYISYLKIAVIKNWRDRH